MPVMGSELPASTRRSITHPEPVVGDSPPVTSSYVLRSYVLRSYVVRSSIRCMRTLPMFSTMERRHLGVGRTTHRF